LGTIDDTPEEDIGVAQGGQDDFSLATDVIDDERRLHLRAFDYWHRLKDDKAYPLFAEIRADDLSPYKENCLLLEFNFKGTVVRFIGERVNRLIDANISLGDYLKDFPESAFARALVEQFATEEGRAKAAEFEFVEDHIECRGMMLPFSSDGSAPNFVMVVSNFRRRDDAEVENVTGTNQNVILESSAIISHPDWNELVSSARQAADNVGHLDSGSRTNLYEALASALALFEVAGKEAGPYKAFLAENGLRLQARAPYTPVLKLVFGKKYDKTRLTEYAAALAYAVRGGHTSETVADFLEKTPGGIKGCVQKERALKRGTEGTNSHDLQQVAEETVRQMPARALGDLQLDSEFALALVRKTPEGTIELLDEAPASNAALAAAIRKIAAVNKK